GTRWSRALPARRVLGSGYRTWRTVPPCDGYVPSRRLNSHRVQYDGADGYWTGSGRSVWLGTLPLSLHRRGNCRIYSQRVYSVSAAPSSGRGRKRRDTRIDRRNDCYHHSAWRIFDAS